MLTVRFRTLPILRGLALLAGLIVGGAVLAARAAEPAATELPKAETILDRYVEVTGGKAAYEKVKNRVMKGTIELLPVGMQGTIAVYQAAPDKMFTHTEIAPLGTNDEGYDGTVAWSFNPTIGPLIKDGAAKATAVRSALFNAEVYWRQLYPKVETLGLEPLEGKPAYKLQLTPVEGEPEIRYYDRETGLHVKTATKIATGAGDMSVEVLFSDYRDVDGVKIACTARQKIVMREVVLTFTEVQQNVELPADRFDLPAQVKTALEQSKGAASQPASSQPAPRRTLRP